MENTTDTFQSSSSFNKSNSIKEKLQLERMKALRLLEISGQQDSSRRSALESSQNRQDITPTTPKTPKTPGLDRTDYISYNSYKTLNITDLQNENTINLESPIKESTSTKTIPNKISFEPSEITGRSTLYRKAVARSSDELSVNEILATSCSGEVRNLCESLRNSSFEYTQSLPKTADISQTSGTDSLMMTNSYHDFSFPNARRANESGFVGESFVPAEQMVMQLDADEMSWEQECATIPQNKNSTDSSYVNQNQLRNISNFSVNSEFDGNNISSLTNFFRQRSVDICNMVGSSDSPERHVPFPLIDISSKGSIDPGSHDNGYNSYSSNPQSKKVNEKTYMRKTIHNEYRDNSLLNTNDLLNQNIHPEAKQDDSYLLSLSSIANAINQIETDETGASVMNRFLLAKKMKSGINPPTSPLIKNNLQDRKTGYSLDPKMNFNQSEKWSKRDKENIDPAQNKKEQFKQLCDTASFTESLLESSGFSNFSVCDTSSKLRDSKINPSTKITDSTHNSYDAITVNKMEKPIVQVNSNAINSSKLPRNFGELSPVMHDMPKNGNNFDTLSSLRNSFSTIFNKNNHLSKTCENNRRSKSPTNSKELYAISGASTSNLLEINQELSDKNGRKRSRSANRNDIKVTNPTISLHELRSAGKHKTFHNKSKSGNSSKLTPDYQMNQSRSPSPIRIKLTPEKYETSSSPSTSFYLPGSKLSAANSPRSPQSLETTTSSDRRYLMAGSSGGSVSGPESPECIGKMSLPTYGLVSKQSSNLMTKSSRSTSQCSSSSEFSHRDGKSLPIKVTCTQFSWGSVKLRTNSKKSMQIKNFSSKRLVLKIIISGPGFQIVNLENNGNMITLQSQECRSVVLNFCPTVLGTAVGTLCFLPPLENSKAVHEIPLYGYGGHAVVIPQDVQKGPIGCPFITMGELHELSRPLVRRFSIYNRGPLAAFAVICVNSMGSDIPRLCDSIVVEPQSAVIRPDDTVTFRCTFKPRRDDLKKIIKKINGVMTVGNLSIITGDEATRQRIRNIIGKMGEIERSRLSSPSLDNCWKKFEHEENISGINKFKEQSDVAMELVSMFRTHEIAITLNHLLMDETSISSQLMFPDVDETILFRTLVSNSIYLKSPDHIESMHSSESTLSSRTQLWSVWPTVLDIDPYDRKTKVSFTVRSLYPTTQYFEITSNFKHIFTITPSSGELTAEEQVEISVHYGQQSFMPHEQIVILVYMENEKITIPVRIKRKPTHQSRLNY